jgi:arylsulfatase A-like enzyme
MRLIHTLVFSLAFTAFACNPHKDKVKNDLPNIILCMSDDHGWGDASYYGHPIIKTPNLDEMAESGLRMDRFYAAAPVCSPTRASLLTGRHPNRMRTFSFGFPIKPEEISIAEVLKERGYVTAHFGKWHIGSIRTESPVHPGKMGFDYWLTSSNYFDNDPIFSRNGNLEEFDGDGSMVLVEEALDFIEEHEGRGRPYFIVLWFAAPHHPYQPKRKFRLMYPDVPMEYRDYYAEISSLDEAMGELRSELRKTYTYENTILWYNGDNGGVHKLSETGGRGNKGTLYEGGLRVPAILEWPAVIKEPAVSKKPITTMDIFPTILEATGTTWKESRILDGTSILPLLDSGDSWPDRKIGFWRYANGIQTPESEFMHIMLREQNDGLEVEPYDILKGHELHLFTNEPLNPIRGHGVWLDWPWKLHRIKELNVPMRYELYNLSIDPDELYDKSAKFPELLKAMEKELHEWQESVSESATGKEY